MLKADTIIENFILISTFAGGLFAVEKVKPDPLNLLVNTDEGKQINIYNVILPLSEIGQGYFLLKGEYHYEKSIEYCRF